ncbi:MAG: peptidylprolyl isomerase, partial [Phycisphaerae bacterium]
MKNAHSSDRGRFPRRMRDSARPTFEALEGRLLLNGSAPEFLNTPGYSYLIDSGGRALTLGIDGFDADGDGLAISAISDLPGLHVDVRQHNPYARLHFVDSGGAEVFGDILVQLFQGRAPEATARFITLATNEVDPDGHLDPSGQPYYTDVNVHRVIDGFMIQTGDATNGDGSGGSPLNDFGDPVGADIDTSLGYSGPGVLGMAHLAALNTNNSQFFITEGTPHHLDGVHFIFGQVISGWDVLDALSQVATTGTNGEVVDPPLLQYVEIIDPADNAQDATVTITADEAFLGAGNVSVTLDDGNGNRTTQVFTISARAQLPEEWVNVAPGESASITPTYSDVGTMDASISVPDLIASTYVSMDPGTFEITIDVPIDATIPEFEVEVSLAESGYTNSETVTRTFTVAPAWGRPVIEDIPAQFVAPGQAVSLTPVITDDGPTPLTVRVQTDHPYVLATINQNTHEITFTAPRDAPAMFSVIVTAGEEGFDPRDRLIHKVIQVFIQDSHDPTVLGGASTSAYGQVLASYQLGDLLYVANDTEGLEIFDISDPANPEKVGEFPTESQAWDVHVIETTRGGGDAKVAFVACLYTGVSVLDVTDPANIVQVDSLPTYDYTVGVHVAGDLLFQCDWQAGLSIYDISDPYRITQTDS